MARPKRSIPRLLRSLAALATVGVTSCSLLVDTSDLDTKVCGANQMACDGRCVSMADPAYGCGDPAKACDPCSLPNAKAYCFGNQCRVERCLFGFECTTPTVGCFDLNYDPEHCGHCGHSCNQATEVCVNGQCVFDPSKADQ